MQKLDEIKAREIQKVEINKRMFFRGVPPPSPAELEIQKFNSNDAIKAMLTPAQQAQFDQFRQGELAAQARAAANMELSHMQEALGLSQTSQDKVFAALYDYALEDLRANGSFRIDRPIDDRIQVLKGALTPDQLDAYRKFESNQPKMGRVVFGF